MVTVGFVCIITDMVGFNHSATKIMLFLVLFTVCGVVVSTLCRFFCLFGVFKFFYYFDIRKYFCNFALHFERGGTFSPFAIYNKVFQV